MPTRAATLRPRVVIGGRVLSKSNTGCMHNCEAKFDSSHSLVSCHCPHNTWLVERSCCRVIQNAGIEFKTQSRCLDHTFTLHNSQSGCSVGCYRFIHGAVPLQSNTGSMLITFMRRFDCGAWMANVLKITIPNVRTACKIHAFHRWVRECSKCYVFNLCKFVTWPQDKLIQTLHPPIFRSNPMLAPDHAFRCFNSTCRRGVAAKCVCT